jgi:hypothetical protein
LYVNGCDNDRINAVYNVTLLRLFGKLCVLRAALDLKVYVRPCKFIILHFSECGDKFLATALALDGIIALGQ